MTKQSENNDLKDIEKWLEKKTLTNEEIGEIYIENLTSGGDPISFAKKILERVNKLNHTK